MLVGESELKSAINACSVLTTAQKASGLWNEGEKLFCQVTMHNIPSFPEDKEVRKLVVLPHTLYPADVDICLIVKNLNEEDPDITVELVKEILKEQEINFIDTILPLNKLKTDYKGHELKRKLVQQFGVFFSDSRISRLAQPHLGSAFYKRRRVPFNIRMENVKTMKKEMEDALKSTQLILTSKGANLNILWGSTELTEEQKVENLSALLEKLDSVIPRGVKNIKAISLQGTNSKAVPIYRNDTVAEEINEQCGMEIERWAAHKKTNQLLKEVQIKKVKVQKKPKGTGGHAGGKSKVKKRKLLTHSRKAKRAKIMEE